MFPIHDPRDDIRSEEGEVDHAGHITRPHARLLCNAADAVPTTGCQ
jgi:hypothetical protein